MQSTGGLINDIIVFGVFIYLTLLVSGKVKLGESNQEKLNNLMERKGTLLKILVYAGTAVFAILILIRLFAFKDSRQVNASKLQTQHRQWTKADKDAMTKACIANAKNSYQKDPVGTTSLCACVTEKFTSKYTYDQAKELNKKPQQEQMDSVIPIIKSCKTEIKPSN